MARIPQLTPTFKAALVTAIQGDASSRRRVGQEIKRLAREELPQPGDREALLPWPGGIGWVREIRELGIWLQYQFDDDTVSFLSVWSRPPVFVE